LVRLVLTAVAAGQVQAGPGLSWKEAVPGATVAAAVEAVAAVASAAAAAAAVAAAAVEPKAPAQQAVAADLQCAGVGISQLAVLARAPAWVVAAVAAVAAVGLPLHCCLQPSPAGLKYPPALAWARLLQMQILSVLYWVAALGCHPHCH
jgi:hypothetical protein